MSKKKKTRKQRRISPTTAPSGAVEQKASAAPVASASQPVVAAAPAAVAVANPHAPYIRSDLCRIGVLVLICIALEFGLLYIFNAGLGSHVYNWITL